MSRWVHFFFFFDELQNRKKETEKCLNVPKFLKLLLFRICYTICISMITPIDGCQNFASLCMWWCDCDFFFPPCMLVFLCCPHSLSQPCNESKNERCLFLYIKNKMFYFFFSCFVLCFIRSIYVKKKKNMLVSRPVFRAL